MDWNYVAGRSKCGFSVALNDNEHSFTQSSPADLLGTRILISKRKGEECSLREQRNSSYEMLEENKSGPVWTGRTRRGWE